MFAESFHRGGPIMYGIAIMSAIALALILERLIALRSEILHSLFGGRSLGERLLAVSRQRQVDWGRFRNHGDPTARVLARLHLDGPEAAAQAGHEALAQGARGLGALDTIVQMSTNVGLLGTVFGVIGVFPHYISGDKTQVVHYLSIALYTTVGGLIIFLYGYLFLRFFRGVLARLGERLERVTHEVETSPSEAGP